MMRKATVVAQLLRVPRSRAGILYKAMRARRYFGNAPLLTMTAPFAVRFPSVTKSHQSR